MYLRRGEYKPDRGWSMNEWMLIFLVILGVCMFFNVEAVFFAVVCLWVEIIMIVGLSSFAILLIRDLIKKFFRF